MRRRGCLWLMILIAGTAIAQDLRIDAVTAWTPDGGYMAPRFSPDGGAVACTDEQFNGIFLVTAPGEVKRLTDRQFSGYGFLWSREQPLIYYRVRQERVFELWKVDLDGREEMLSTPASRFTPPELSRLGYYVRDLSRGRMTAFARSDSGQRLPVCYAEGHRVYVESGGLRKPISTEATKSFSPVVSPDGRRIAYSSLSEGLFIYDLQNEERIAVGTGTHPSWSPDGKRLLFDRVIDDGHRLTASELYLFDPDGRRYHQLTRTAALIERYPVFSPDGSRVAFSAGGTIYIGSFPSP